MKKKIIKWIEKRWRELWSPPAHALDDAKSFRHYLAVDWREIILIDLTIWAFMIPSMTQMAYVFGDGYATFTSYSKAAGLDVVIWLLSRAVGRLSIGAQQRAAQASVERLTYKRGGRVAAGVRGVRNYGTSIMLWTGLLVFIGITTAVNTLYEFDNPGKPGMQYNIPYNIDLLRMVLASSLLGFIILFLTFVRQLRHESMRNLYQSYKIAEGIETAKMEEPPAKKRGRGRPKKYA